MLKIDQPAVSAAAGCNQPPSKRYVSAGAEDPGGSIPLWNPDKAGQTSCGRCALKSRDDGDGIFEPELSFYGNKIMR